MRQPLIKDAIIRCFQENPAKGFVAVEKGINHWCSQNTIYRWISNHNGYGTYTERVIPLITEEQKKRQVKFAELLTNRWQLSTESHPKILLVNYDEKWFFGMVPRTMAKMCPALGLFRGTRAIYHKNFINKVMVVAITGYAFEGEMECGGNGIKIGIIRVQGARIAKKNRQRINER